MGSVFHHVKDDVRDARTLVVFAVGENALLRFSSADPPKPLTVD